MVTLRAALHFIQEFRTNKAAEALKSILGTRSQTAFDLGVNSVS